MVWKRWVAMVVVAVAVFAGTPRSGAGGQTDDEEIGGRRCTVATLRGGYGIQIQGTRPAAPPAPAGTTESVIGVIVRHYDGEGQFTQVNNEKGSLSGLGPADREGFGTYQVNGDCTGSHGCRFQGSRFQSLTGS